MRKLILRSVRAWLLKNHAKSAKNEIFDRKIRFLPIWRDFWGATAERMSKSSSSSNFALDWLIERSVRPKNLGFDENLRFLKIFHQIAGVRFSGGIISTASYFFKIFRNFVWPLNFYRSAFSIRLFRAFFCGGYRRRKKMFFFGVQPHLFRAFFCGRYRGRKTMILNGYGPGCVDGR